MQFLEGHHLVLHEQMVEKGIVSSNRLEISISAEGAWVVGGAGEGGYSLYQIHLWSTDY